MLLFVGTWQIRACRELFHQVLAISATYRPCEYLLILIFPISFNFSLHKKHLTDETKIKQTNEPAESTQRLMLHENGIDGISITIFVKERKGEEDFGFSWFRTIFLPVQFVAMTHGLKTIIFALLFFRLVHNNKISGPIPSEIGQLLGLITLDLSTNQFTGEIPDSLGQLTQLGYL